MECTVRDKDVLIFHNSKRRYKNAKVHVQRDTGSWHKMLALKEITEYLEYLEFGVSDRLDLDFPKDLEFLKLKIVKLKQVKGDDIRSLLDPAPVGLEEMHIDSYSLFEKPFTTMSAKLVSFSVHSTVWMLENHHENLKDFLASTSSTMKSLRIPHIDHAIFELVLKDMKVLEVLTISACQLNTSSDIRNQTISTLAIERCVIYRDLIGLRAFKNLRTIQIDHCSEKTLENILSHCNDDLRIQIGSWHEHQCPGYIYVHLMQSNPSIARNITFVHKRSSY
jgi:hypothetical protein